jgi:hypothetical protein
MKRRACAAWTSLALKVGRLSIYRVGAASGGERPQPTRSPTLQLGLKRLAMGNDKSKNAATEECLELANRCLIEGNWIGKSRTLSETSLNDISKSEQVTKFRKGLRPHGPVGMVAAKGERC